MTDSGAAAARHPPAAQQVVFDEGAHRGCGSPNEPHAQQTSSAADPRRRSKRPCTERTHIPTIPTPAERAREAALHTGPHQAKDGAFSSSAASLPTSPAGLPPGGRNAADARPGEPQQTSKLNRGWGDEPLKAPPPERRV